MRKYLLTFTLLLALSTGASIWLTQENANSFSSLSPAAGEAQAGTGEALIGGDFTLTDQHGKTVQDKDFRGKLMLVFFGFTHCPDICPISSASLSKTMELLGGKADNVAPIFITVDPERDTPKVMADYFANFDKRMVALTGTSEQVKRVADAYKAYYGRTMQPQSDEPEADDDSHGAHDAHAGANYMVDHSGYIYLMGKDGKYIRHFSYNASPEEMAAAVQEQLK